VLEGCNIESFFYNFVSLLSSCYLSLLFIYWSLDCSKAESMQSSTHNLDSVVLQLHTAKTLGSMPVLGIPLRTSKLLASINEASGGKLQLAIVPAMTGMD
jgi:hypothetical protein